MKTEGPGVFPCSHPADLDGLPRIQALRMCLGRESSCPPWQSAHGEVWQNILAERRLQYMRDDIADVRRQVERVMEEVRRCVQAGDLIEDLLDLMPGRVVMEDLLVGLHRRDDAAARANSLWLAAWSALKCGHRPAPPSDTETTKAARDAIVATVPRGRERELVLAIADAMELKVYTAIDRGTLTGNFDGWRKQAISTTKIDELRRRNPAAAKKPRGDSQDAQDSQEGAIAADQPLRPHPRSAWTFSELVSRDPEGREGLLPAVVEHIPATDEPPDEVVIQREVQRALRQAFVRAITDYATRTWKDPAEAQAKARILYARMLEKKEYSELAASKDAQAYGHSVHALEIIVSRAKKALSQDAEFRRQWHETLSDEPDPPLEGGPPGAT